MEHFAPIWQPNEPECLQAILEIMIDEGVLATRQKLGYSDTMVLDNDFSTNIGLDLHRLLRLPEIMRMLSDFFPYFWLTEQSSWECIPISEHRTILPKVLLKALEEVRLRWREDGSLILADIVTPEVAALVRTHKGRLLRVITLLGPSVSYACLSWSLQPYQYKALVCQDTLTLLEPHIRWNMIYGSRI